MTKREECVEVMARAVIEQRRRCADAWIAAGKSMADMPTIPGTLVATAALDAALRVLGEPDAEMVAGTARAIAAEILAQDDVEDFRLQDTLKIDWLDQGEVDFAEVARAAYKGILATVGGEKG